MEAYPQIRFLFMFQKKLEQKTIYFLDFLRKNKCVGAFPPKNVFLQILKSVNDLEILAPELVGGQSEMVVLTILSHIFMIMRLITWKPSYVICRVSTT